MDVTISCFDTDHMDYSALVRIEPPRKRRKPTPSPPPSNPPFTFSYATAEHEHDRQHHPHPHHHLAAEEQSTFSAHNFGITEQQLQQLLQPFLATCAPPPQHQWHFSITDDSATLHKTTASTSSSTVNPSDLQSMHAAFGLYTVPPTAYSDVQLCPVAADATDSNKSSRQLR